MKVANVVRSKQEVARANVGANGAKKAMKNAMKK